MKLYLSYVCVAVVLMGGSADAKNLNDILRALGGVVPVQSSSSANSMSQWTRQIVDILARNKRYPADALSRGEEGKAIILFTLDRAGHLIGSRIDQSSGSPSLDREAIDLLKRTAPFEPVPAVYVGSQVTLRLPLSFSIPDGVHPPGNGEDTDIQQGADSAAQTQALPTARNNGFQPYNFPLHENIVAKAKSVWRNLPPNEIACIDQLLQEENLSIDALVDHGIVPSDPSVSNLRADCEGQKKTLTVKDQTDLLSQLRGLDEQVATTQRDANLTSLQRTAKLDQLAEERRNITIRDYTFVHGWQCRINEVGSVDTTWLVNKADKWLVACQFDQLVLQLFFRTNEKPSELSKGNYVQFDGFIFSDPRILCIRPTCQSEFPSRFAVHDIRVVDEPTKANDPQSALPSSSRPEERSAATAKDLDHDEQPVHLIVPLVLVLAAISVIALIVISVRSRDSSNRAANNTAAQVVSGAPRYAGNSKLIGFGLLLIGILAWFLFAYLKSSPDIRAELITIGSIPALKITNIGTDNLQITSVTFNSRTECQPLLIGAFAIPVKFSAQLLKVGDAMVALPGCIGINIVRVAISERIAGPVNIIGKNEAARFSIIEARTGLSRRSAYP